jgi:hypothetical protein
VAQLKRGTLESAALYDKAYVPRPFRPEERKDVEILFGGLHGRVERAIQAVFKNLEYRAKPSPNCPATQQLLSPDTTNPRKKPTCRPRIIRGLI